MSNRLRLTRVILVIVFNLSAFQTVLAEQTLTQQIDLLDNEYQQLAEQIYSAQVDQQTRFDDIESLLAEYQNRLSSNSRAEANRLVVANNKLVTEYPANPLLITLVETLLNDNEKQLAETIYGFVESSGDDTNLPYLDYSFAKYYARHRQWQQVNSILQSIPIELSGDDADYAYLLQGISWQYLKQHRMSVQSYDNIAEASPFYLHARLNTALANLRQGWTTEAQAIMTNLAPVSRSLQKSEFTNRIYLVLGYALLQKEFFRDARNAFRNVSSESSYSSKALFGIALSAVSQRDYSGGLNAVNLLIKKSSQSMSRDEAYLLVPYIYERLGRKLQVEESFSIAMDHFQTRLLQWQKHRNQPIDIEQLHFDGSGKLELSSLKLDFSKEYPQYLITNRHNLWHLVNNLGAEGEFLSRVKDLLSRYDSLINKVIAKLIDRQIGFLNSYLNQARYGLARHIDEQAQVLQ